MKNYMKNNGIQIAGELMAILSMISGIVFIFADNIAMGLTIMIVGCLSGMLIWSVGRIVKLLENILHSINYFIENNKKSE